MRVVKCEVPKQDLTLISSDPEIALNEELCLNYINLISSKLEVHFHVD